MATVPIQILRFVDGHQPGWVEGAIHDADGVEHRFVEKVPVVTRENLTAASIYPQTGAIACEVLAHWSDATGRALSRITTRHPWGVESVTGFSEFVVPSAMVEP
jgi:hypothetical protein